MKKYLKVVVVLALCVFLTGCGKERKITCTQSTMGVDITFNVDFKGNKVEGMDILYFMDLSNYSDSQIKLIENKDFCSNVKSAMASYKDGFENCKQEVKDKKLNVTADFNIKKISNSVLDTMGSPKATKTSLEEQGYTCTLK